MPNHCYNVLFVTGPKEEKGKFVGELTKEPNSDLCRAFKPMPKELEDCPPLSNRGNHSELKKRYGHVDWYSWARHNWGTKWGCYSAELDVNKKRVKYECLTAWGPPNTELLLEISKAFPSLEFSWRYKERGMAFQGKLVIKNGELLQESDGDYHGAYGG